MGFRAADILRSRCAVDAVAGAIQTNPCDANGIVRARWQDQFMADLAGFRRFRKNFRVEGVIGIRCDDHYVEQSNGTLLDALSNAAREMGDEVGIGIERLQSFGREMNGKPGGLAGIFGIGGVGNLQRGASGDIGPGDVGVKLADQIGVRKRFFRDEFKDVLIVQRGLLGLAEPCGRERLKPRDVIGGDGVGGVGRTFENELVFSGGVELAGGVVALLPLKSGNGRACLRTDGAVN